MKTEAAARLRSFAKINLGLEVTGRRREDQYHLLRTVFQTIDFGDDIRVTPRKDRECVVEGDWPGIDWNQDDTISRAFRVMDREYHLPHGFNVRVHKRVPPGSGLGGGSGNAAVCMLYFADYFDLNPGLEEWVRLAVAVGADVPFFLAGGTVLAEGIGERLTLLDDLNALSLVLALPDVEVSTARVFKGLRLTRPAGDSKIETFLDTRELAGLENDLEAVAFAYYPQVRAAKDAMSAAGCSFAAMSGSGGAVFGIPDPGPSLERFLPGVRKVRSRFIARKEYQERIGAWPSGKAPVFGAGIRRFESSRPSMPRSGRSG